VFDSTKRTDGTSPHGTTGTWIISVDDRRWRALVELLLPPSEIASTSREDDEVSGQLDRSRRRPA